MPEAGGVPKDPQLLFNLPRRRSTMEALCFRPCGILFLTWPR
jgi:hypothetical protein